MDDGHERPFEHLHDTEVDAKAVLWPSWWLLKTLIYVVIARSHPGRIWN